MIVTRLYAVSFAQSSRSYSTSTSRTAAASSRNRRCDRTVSDIHYRLAKGRCCAGTSCRFSRLHHVRLDSLEPSSRGGYLCDCYSYDVPPRPFVTASRGAAPSRDDALERSRISLRQDDLVSSPAHTHPGQRIYLRAICRLVPSVERNVSCDPRKASSHDSDDHGYIASGLGPAIQHGPVCDG